MFGGLELVSQQGVEVLDAVDEAGDARSRSPKWCDKHHDLEGKRSRCVLSLRQEFGQGFRDEGHCVNRAAFLMVGFIFKRSKQQNKVKNLS